MDQLIPAFVECLLELEDLTCSDNLSEEEEKEKYFLQNELKRLLTRIILEAINEKK